MVIEQEQIIILANEILKERFSSKDPRKVSPEEASETFELISSAVEQNAITLRELRRRIRSLITY
jgi:hypothetical protein